MKQKKETSNANVTANLTAVSFGLAKAKDSWQLVKVMYDPATLATSQAVVIYEDPYRDVVMERFMIEASVFNEVK